MTKTSAFRLAIQVQDLTRVCLLASENETSGRTRCERGIDGTLELLENLTETLVTVVEDLEANQIPLTGQEQPTHSSCPTDNPDPIVDLFQRWSEMREVQCRLMDECPTGESNAPDLLELGEMLHALEREILEMTPSSTAGVAALADFQWHMFGTEALEGTETWSQALERPEVKLMRHLRHGAHLVAA